MAALYLIAGINHFVAPDFYFKMIPGYLPYPMALVYISGVAEIIVAVALVIPQTTRIAAWSLIVLLLAVFPANVYMASERNPISLFVQRQRVSIELRDETLLYGRPFFFDDTKIDGVSKPIGRCGHVLPESAFKNSPQA
jgi:uncharacterized membrane protein